MPTPHSSVNYIEPNFSAVKGEFSGGTFLNWALKDDYERDLLSEGLYIMEIKSTVNFPLWLVKELSRLKIYPHSFSKYGEEYKLLIKEGDLHGIF